MLIFLGRRELFKGLWLDDSDYTWTTHPVVRVDFSLFRVESAGKWREMLTRYIAQLTQSYQLTVGNGAYHEPFADLTPLKKLKISRKGAKMLRKMTINLHVLYWKARFAL